MVTANTVVEFVAQGGEVDATKEVFELVEAGEGNGEGTRDDRRRGSDSMEVRRMSQMMWGG
jgi:hypothetical protein